MFHYHLVTSRAREVEARYIGKLGFELVGRYGRIGEETTSVPAGLGWDELDRRSFKLRLTELERGAVNVVVQPGQWQLPRIDHIGLALDEDEFSDAVERAADLDMRVQDHGGQRAFVATGAGYRLELHPPHEWLDELLGARGALHLAELHVRADDAGAKADALASLLRLEVRRGAVEVGDTIVRFLPGGPAGRPELYGELFV